MKLLAKILNQKQLSKIILRNLELNTIRMYLDKNFLSPIEAFILDGYHEKLYSNLPLDRESKVIILGGYVGTSAQLLHVRYFSNIIVVEPLPHYVQILKSKLTDPKFKIFSFAVSDKNGKIKLGVSSEKSGKRAESSEFFLAKCVKASDFMREIKGSIDLMEINIEGSEYEVLDDLIKSSQIRRIMCLLVQFHRDSIEDEVKRSLLRQELSRTHYCVFNYLLVWERWDLIPNSIVTKHSVNKIEIS